MIDEPKWSSRFGGDSAAPAFGRICESLASSTPIFDDVLSVEVVRASQDDGGSRVAPNFLRMEREAALEAARRGGSNVICEGKGGRVVAQTPGPGAPIHSSDVIRLVVAGGVRESRRAFLDMQGNQRLRQAYRVDPGKDETPGSRSPDEVRVGMGSSRAASLMAMAGVRGRGER
jgi:hypothetical protein